MNTIKTLKFAGMSALLALSLSACDSTHDASPVSPDQSMTGVSSQSDQGGISGTDALDIRIDAALIATAADPLASGTARWESRPDRITFTCEVEDVTTSGSHEVQVNGVTVGSVNVVAGLGDLNMDSRDGDIIPAMKSGDRVTVLNPSGRVILRGRFQAR